MIKFIYTNSGLLNVNYFKNQRLPSREELRQHIHIQCEHGEAKFWLDPQIELAKNYKLSRKELNEVEKIIEDHYEDFIKAWEEHFGN